MTAAPPAGPDQSPDQWLAALDRVMARVGAAAAGQAMLDALVEGVANEFGVAMVALWAYDPAEDALRLRATAGLAGYRERAPATLDPRDRSLGLSRIVATLESEVVDPIAAESGFKEPDWLAAQGLRAYAGLPIALGEQGCGALSLFHRAPWPARMLEALAILARQAALAIEHARLIEESQTLQAISTQVAAAREPQALLQELVQRTREALGADGSAVWFLDEGSGALEPAASDGLSDEFLADVRLPAAVGTSALFNAVRETGRPLYTRDDQAEARVRNPQLAMALAREGVVSALRLPLFEPGGRVAGMFALYHRRERHYSDSEVRLAQAFTDGIAMTLHNARLAEKEREAQATAARQLERLTTLARITEQLLASTDPDAVLRVVAESAVRLCEARGAVVGVVEPGMQKLTPAATHGDLTAWFESFTDRNLDEAYLQSSATGLAITTGQAVLLPDYAARPVRQASQAQTLAAGVRAFIAAPLRKGETLLGVLWVANTEPGSLTEEDAVVVQALADQAALALEQARLIEESHALQVIAAELASKRETHAMLEGIVQRTMAALGADGCAVWLMDEETGRLAPAAAKGLPKRFLDRIQRILDEQGQDPAIPFHAVRASRHAHYAIDDRVRARAERDPATDVLEQEGIVSALRLPLFEPGGEVVGMLALYHRARRAYGEGEIRLAQAFADQIAVALHNARLAEDERGAREAAARQLERLQTITTITERLLAATELDDVLRIVVEAAGRLCDGSGACVGLVEEGGRRISAVAFVGEPHEYFEHTQHLALDEEFYAHTATGQAFTLRAPVVVEDYARWSTPNAVQQDTVDLGVHAFIAAPLLLGGEPIGVLWVNDTKPRPFESEDVGLVQALADQAALAIEHARLVQRGQEAAVIEERTRLARDLHDSVTQSVFSVSMMARAAITQHERGSDRLGTTLERIAQLSQDALKEMRSLLFELQPPNLAEEGLSGALRKLCDAFRQRMDVEVTFLGDCGVRLPATVETAIFRIVQEALANASKHSKASAVSLQVDETPDRLRIVVRDNGVGFDPLAPATTSADGRRGGMGMRTMRERAEAAGLEIGVRSQLGDGTSVVIDAALELRALAGSR